MSTTTVHGTKALTPPRLNLLAVGGKGGSKSMKGSTGNRCAAVMQAPTSQPGVEEASRVPQVGSAARLSTSCLVGGGGKESNDEAVSPSHHRNSVPDAEGFVQPRHTAKAADVTTASIDSAFADDNRFSWLHDEHPEFENDSQNELAADKQQRDNTAPAGGAQDKSHKALAKQWSDYDEDEDIGPVPDFSTIPPVTTGTAVATSKDLHDKVVILEAKKAFLMGTRQESERINQELKAELDALKAQQRSSSLAPNPGVGATNPYWASSVLPASSSMQRAISGSPAPRGGQFGHGMLMPLLSF